MKTSTKNLKITLLQLKMPCKDDLIKNNPIILNYYDCNQSIEILNQKILIMFLICRHKVCCDLTASCTYPCIPGNIFVYPLCKETATFLNFHYVDCRSQTRMCSRRNPGVGWKLYNELVDLPHVPVPK